MRRRVDPAEAERARARLAASFIPCHSCANPQAGRLHRKSERLWRERADRHAGCENGTTSGRGAG